MSHSRVAKLASDTDGAVLIEFAFVFGVFIFVALAAIDLSYMFFDWARVNKVTYVGAHRAVVSSPVASGITSLAYDVSHTGDLCFDSSGNFNTTVCPSVSAKCTPANSGTGGTCAGGGVSYGWDETAFQNILQTMQDWYGCSDPNTCPLQRGNIVISYESNGLGFNGRPDGLPMIVTVTTKCIVHRFFFLGRWFNSAFAPSAADQCSSTDPVMPSYTTTLPSEDMVTNDP